MNIWACRLEAGLRVDGSGSCLALETNKLILLRPELAKQGRLAEEVIFVLASFEFLTQAEGIKQSPQLPQVNVVENTMLF